ncbi:MAG: GNAT family N-acetyltransferase [Desulfocapsaceae bacterium]|nr:GNAT family N-acetyltransferase [Desulfocapsaceae bacterium]
MTDLLVKLYDIQDEWTFMSEQRSLGIIVRKPIGPEKNIVVDWVKEQYGDDWASEADMAFANRPISCFVAIKKERLVGFACYDATALGFFGPTGVKENCRGRGTGKALLLACLLDMKLKGYGYAVIGGAGPVKFYKKTVGAIEIPGSTPGLYAAGFRREAK